MRFFLESVLRGLLAGGPYALVGIGFALAHGVTGVVQLAHGELVTLGAFVAALTLAFLHLDPLLAVAAAAPIFFAAGALLHRVALRRLPRERPGATLLATAGLAVVLTGLVALARSAGATAPAALDLVEPLEPRPLAIPFAAAAVLAGVVHLFLRHTDLGRAVRATAQDPEATQLLGIDVATTGTVAVGLAAALAGAAGALLAGVHPLTPSGTGTAFTARALAILLLARPGSVPSGLAAGLLVGLVEGVVTGMTGGAEGAGALAAFALLLALLLFRPGRLRDLAGGRIGPAPQFPGEG